ncbi:MAG: beta strand repeat-containing protein [Actinomycetota bacterium]
MNPPRRVLAMAATAVAGIAALVAPGLATAGSPNAAVQYMFAGPQASGTPAALELVNGGLSTITIGARHDYAGTSTGPTTLSLDLPQGATLVRTSTLIPGAGLPVPAKWQCSGQVPRVDCTLIDVKTGGPYPLPDSQTAELMVVVKGASPVPALAAGAAPVDAGTASVSMSTQTPSGDLTATASIPAQAVAGPLPPRIVLTQVAYTAPTPATGSTKDGFDIMVRNVGGLDATTSSTRPAIQMSSVLKDLQVRGLTLSGRAWKCTPPADITCTYRGTVAVGAAAEALQVRWKSRLDAGQLTGAWQINGTAGFAPQPTPLPPSGSPPSSQQELSTGSASFSAAAVVKTGSTLANLAVQATAPKGIEVLAGRSASSVRARIDNVGTTYAPVVGLRIQTAQGVTASIPTKGWSCTGRSPTFTCSSSTLRLNPGAGAGVDIALSAPPTEKAVSSKLDLTPLGRKLRVRGKSFGIPLRVLDPGDPQATPQIWFKQKNGTFTQWRHGGYTKTATRDAFTYRLAVVNDGGDVLAAGTKVSLTQAIGKGIPVDQVVPGPGVTCAKGAVRCTITPSGPVNPGTTFATVQVTIRPTATAERAAMGDVVTRVAGIPGDESLPMKLRIVDNPNSLRPSMKVTQSPTSGGVGAMVMAVINEADQAATGLQVTGTVPADLTVTQAKGGGWSCTIAGRKLSCAYPSTLPAGKRTAALSMRMVARGKAATRPDMQWNATGVAPDGIHQRGMRKGPVPIRGPIFVSAVATPTVVSASRDTSATRRRIGLDGSKSAGSGISLDDLWRQRCTTPADAQARRACAGAVAPRAVIGRPHVASTHAVLPRVSRRTKFVFELQITDGSAVKSQLVTVTQAMAGSNNGSAPKASGTSPDAAADRAKVAANQKSAAQQRASTTANQQVTRQRAYSSNAANARTENSKDAPRVTVDGAPLIQARKGQSVSLVARPRGRITSSATYEWTQVSGTQVSIDDARRADARITTPDVSEVLVFRVTARDPSGLSASAEVAVAVDLQPSPQYDALSSQAGQASKTGKPMPINLGSGITGTLGRVKQAAGSSAVQNQSSTQSYTFSGSTFSVGAVQVKGASGTMNLGGVQITAGQVVLPSSIGIGPIAVSSASPLILTFAAGSQPATLVGQVVDSNSFALLPLPGGWSGSTTITFGSSSWAIDASAVGDGNGTVSLSGTLSQSGTYTVQVQGNNLLHIGSATIDVGGQLSNATGTVQSSITGSLAQPVELAPGVTIPSLTATWSPGATGAPVVRGSGALQIISGSTSIQVNAAVAFNSSANWKLTLTGSGGASWSPVPGLTVTPSDLSGSVGMSNSAWQWNVTGTVSQWNVTSVLTLNNIQLDLTNQCSGNSPPCPNGSMFFGIDVSAVLDPPLISPITAQADAIIGLGSGGGFSMSASLGTINIAPGISLQSPGLNVAWNMPAGTVPSGAGLPSFSNSTEGGFAISATGGLNVPGLGSFSQIVANITSQGWSLGGFDPNGVSLASGNGSQSSTYFGWSSFAATMTADVPNFGPQTLNLTAGTISVTGGYVAPSWFSKVTGAAAPNALGTIQFNPSNGFFNASISLPGVFNLPGGGSKMDAVGLSFDIQNDSAGLTVNVGATVNLSVKGMNGGAMTSAPQLDLDLGFDVTTQTVQASLTFLDPAGWNNAFDVSGLTVNEASFTLSINLDTMIPGLSLLASGALPESITGPFSVPNQSQIPITVGAELSDTNPCVEFQVGNTNGTQEVLQVGGGVATANYFEFILAPTGCQLSPQSQPIPAGFQMAFDGSLLGATVDVSAAVFLAPSTSFTANVDIGAFGLGGLQFQQTKIGVSIDEATQVNDVSFSGGFTIFGNGVSVAGSLDQNGATTKASLTVSELGDWTVDGFSLQDMKVSAAVTFGPGVDDVDVSASGKMNLLGQIVDVNQFSVQEDNGVVEEVAFNITTSVGIEGAFTASGNFDMQYTESSGNFDLNAAVVLTTAAGFSIGTPQNPATLDISPQCTAFEGDLAFTPVFTATLSGTMAYQAGCKEQVQNAQGQMVTPAAGDFSFAADDVTLAFGPLEAQGSVSMGDVGGVGYANVATTLQLSPQSTNNSVSLSGDFQSNGNFAFNGSAKLDLAGFLLQTQVSASNQNGTVTVAGSAGLSIGGTQVDISGQFSETDGAPSTTLTGAIPSLSLGGYDVGNASITLTQSPVEMGVEAAVAMQVGNPSSGQIQAQGQISFVDYLAQPNAPLYFASLSGSMGVPSLGATVTGSGQFGDCTDNCTQPAPVDFVLNGSIGTSGFWFNTSVDMSAAGEFSASANTGANVCSGTVDLVFIQAQACFDYNINLFLGSYAPYGALSASAGADVQVQTWNASPWYEPWKWSWGNWHTWGLSVGASVQIDPFQVCVDVMGANLCV